LDFYIEDEILHIKGKPEVGVTLLNGEPYIISENYKGSIDKFDKSNLDRNYVLLLFTLREITSDPKKKVKSSIYRGFNTKNRGACEFWDTYWVFQFGISESTAEEGFGTTEELETLDRAYEDNGYESEESGEDFYYEEEGYDVTRNCSRIGDLDTSCLTDEHGCLATQAWCCPD